MASALAATLSRSYGIRKGDPVALLMANSWQLALIVLALFKLGAIVVALNTKLRSQELDFLLQDSGSSVLVVDPEWWTHIEPICAKLPIEYFIGSRQIEGRYFLTIPQLIDEGRRLPPIQQELSEWDPALIIYTSGTTGRPKGAVMTHRNLIHAILSDIRTLGVSHRDRTVVAGQMCYVTGLIAQFLLFLFIGGTTFIMPRFDAAGLLNTLREERITFFHAAPAIYVFLISVPGYQQTSLPYWRLAVAGGSATTLETIHRLKTWLPHLDFRTRYGMTETSSPAIQMPGGKLKEKKSSCGLLIPTMESKVMNAYGQELPAGQAGELWLRGPNVIGSYWRNPSGTKQAIVDGWLRTGDVAKIDIDGFFYILDRVKDMINRGGEKVYCIEVERVLGAHPAILESAVVAVPDPVYGELVKAVVVLRPNQIVSPEEIKTWVGGRLAKYKVPAQVEFIDSLPRNPNGKVIKDLLRGSLRGTTSL
jgi:long-chain acyl-CoA synthetase